jgi:hypothetical protein
MTFYIIISVLILGIFFLFRFLRNVQPDDFEVASDIKELKKSVAEFKGGLEKWEKGISSADIDQIIEKSNQRSGKGLCTCVSELSHTVHVERKQILLVQLWLRPASRTTTASSS